MRQEYIGSVVTTFEVLSLSCLQNGLTFIQFIPESIRLVCGETVLFVTHVRAFRDKVLGEDAGFIFHRLNSRSFTG